MWSKESFARFERALERDGERGGLDFADVVDLADLHGLSLGEASEVIGDRRRWQRVFVDEHGDTVHPDIAARAFADAALGGHCPYHVVWRRAGPASGYLLA